MPDIQNQENLEAARAKLQEVAERKEARESEDRGGDIPQQEYPSRRMIPEEKEIRPVSAKPKKKKFGQKMKEAMFGDGIGDGSITEHIFFRIFVPSTKRVISEMANSAINMALGLDPKTRTLNGGNPHTANASTYRDRNYFRRNEGGPGYSRRDAVSEFEWDEETAKDIYTQLCEIIDRYGEASIADAYSVMGMGDKIRTTDKYWGWTSMRNADVVCVDRSGDRWIVDMPSAKPLN